MPQQTIAFSPNIQNGLKYLRNQDARAFVRKFQQQSKDERQFAHTMIELIPGIFGARMGFIPEYEPNMEGQTPDCRFLDPEAKPCFFAEVVNLHMNEDIEKEMRKALKIDDIWSGNLPNSADRLYPTLENKMGKYRALADKVDLPFVVFIYGWFNAFLDPVEIEYCLSNMEWGIFKKYPQLSGAYHFDNASLDGGYGGNNPDYRFRFYTNPDATRPLPLTDGLVPFPIPYPSKDK